MSACARIRASHRRRRHQGRRPTTRTTRPSTRKSRDGYELFLHNPLLNNVGKDLAPQLAITFHSLEGKDLCRVAIQPSPRPVFIKEGQFEHLYLRTGNSTRLLTTKETIDYCKARWKAA